MTHTPTPHVATDGSVYVHGHMAECGDLPDLFAPFIGRTMLAHVWDRGAIKPTRLTLRGFDGPNVHITLTNGQELTADTCDILGQRATRVDADPATVDLRSYCLRCHRDTLPYGLLCDRRERVDLGTDRDRESSPARYEGVCLTCCGHNHA